MTTLNLNVTQRGVWIECSSMETLRRLKNYFTLRNKDYKQQVQVHSIWRLVGNRMYLPRFGAFRLESKSRFEVEFNNQIVSSGKNLQLEWNGSPTDNQSIIIEYILSNQYKNESVQMGKAGLILNLEAGQGKTFVAIGLMARLCKPTLIIVHNTSILSQWVRELTKAFDVTVGILSATAKTKEPIQVAVINSLLKSPIQFNDKTEQNVRAFFAEYDFVIFDEAHEYCSKMRSQIFWVCQRPYMLGLSATPDERLDNLDAVAHYNIGPVLKASTLPGFSGGSNGNFQAQVTRIKYYGPEEYTRHLVNEMNEMSSVPKMINQIAEDPFRSEMVIDETLKLLDKNHNVFVFADRRSYLEILQSVLGKRSPELSVCLLGGAKDEEIFHTEAHAKVILTTYQYMGTGKSIPKMDALVLATPRKSKSKQFIGRIFRLGGNDSVCRSIVDIVDMKTVLKNQWYERKKYYEDRQIPISDRDVVISTLES
jgi:superfamily II DNA or RNA helicase